MMVCFRQKIVETRMIETMVTEGLKDFFKQVTVATRIIEMTVIAVSNDGML